MGLEPGLWRLDRAVAQRAGECPEARAVVHVHQMGDLVGDQIIQHLGRRKDDKQLHPSQVSLGKLNNVRQALQIARTARTVLGANGVTLEYPVIRHMNNLESVLTYEGTTEMHALIVGKEITGLDAFQ